MFPEGFDSDLLQAVLVSLIDILVVAYVFYRVLLVIRGTRAQQVLVGLAILVVGFLRVRALGLTTLTWIFDNFIGHFSSSLSWSFRTISVDSSQGLARAR